MLQFRNKTKRAKYYMDQTILFTFMKTEKIFSSACACAMLFELKNISVSHLEKYLDFI